MALFKVLRGSSTALNSQPYVDGYAYFTPDDGRFYIDVALAEEPDYYYSKSTGTTPTIYRIELESATWAELNDTKMDKLTRIDWSKIDNFKPLVLTAGTTTYTFNGTSTISLALQSDWAETSTTSTTYIKNKPTIINVGITVDDEEQTLFITSPITNGDEVSY